MNVKHEPGEIDSDQAIALIQIFVKLLHGFGFKVFKDGGLRPPQVAFLGFLHDVGPLGMSTISKLTGVTGSVATRFIERLERKGLVERLPDEKDRRAVLVRLSDEGTRLMGDMLEAYKESLNEILVGIDREDFQVFLSVLAQINEKLVTEFPLEDISEILSAHMDAMKEGSDEKKR